jgi:hypothetical protein
MKQCSICGVVIDENLRVCSKCHTQQRIQVIVYTLISVVVVVVIVAGIIGYQVISTENGNSGATGAGTNSANADIKQVTSPDGHKRQNSSPGIDHQPANQPPLVGQSANTSNGVNNGAAGGVATGATTAQVLSGQELADLANYATAAQPQLADLTTVMNHTVADLKKFLQQVNHTTDKVTIRRTINEFRAQLQGYEQQLDNIHDKLQTTVVPPLVQPSHQAIITGVEKYQQALQGYTQGLAEYNFARIKASQATLETADKEIRQAATTFQQQINALP